MLAWLLTVLFWFFVVVVVAVCAAFYFRKVPFHVPSVMKERILLPDGQILEGPDKTLGRGGFGVVAQYTLMKELTRTSVAVKKPLSTDDNESQKHELNMLKTAGPHKNIITLMTSVSVRNKLYLVFELMQGTVKDLLKAHPRLSLATKLSILTQMLQGVVHIHGLMNGMFTRTALVHQDLKPENLLVNTLADKGDIQVKIGDFGIARIVDEYKMPIIGNLATISHKGPAGGTYDYMAPEVISMLESQQNRGCNRASDVFSVGMIMWEIATGQKPTRSQQNKRDGAFPAFKSDQAHCSTTQTTSIFGIKSVKGKPDYPLSGLFGPVIDKCIQPEPSSRASAAKVLEQVQGIQPR